MQELSGPVVGIALVLSAVFVPQPLSRASRDASIAICRDIAISVLLSAFKRLLSARHSRLCSFDQKQSRDCSTDFSIGSTVCSDLATEGYVAHVAG